MYHCLSCETNHHKYFRKSEEGKARALDNIGRTYARKGDYSEAVK